MKAIIIDDNHLVLKGLRQLIPWDSLDIELVAQASNGLQGYKRIVEENPDIIITDVKMPVMNGLELCEKIKDRKGIVIILSAFEDFSYAKKAMSLGISNYVLKPITKKKVAEIIQILKDYKDAQFHEQRYMDIFIEENIDEQLLEALNAQSTHTIDRFFEDSLPKLYETRAEAKHVAIHIINTLYRYFSEKGLNAESLLKSKSNTLKEVLALDNPADIFTDIQKLYAKVLQFSGQKDDDQDLVRHSITIIQEEFGNPELSVSHLSDKLYISPDYLNLLFKKQTGQTISSYIILQRMNRSMELLRNPDLTVRQIAGKVGYNDSRYFAKAFKKHTGYTPSQYRKKITYTG